MPIANIEVTIAEKVVGFMFLCMFCAHVYRMSYFAFPRAEVGAGSARLGGARSACCDGDVGTPFLRSSWDVTLSLCAIVAAGAASAAATQTTNEAEIVLILPSVDELCAPVVHADRSLGATALRYRLLFRDRAAGACRAPPPRRATDSPSSRAAGRARA